MTGRRKRGLPDVALHTLESRSAIKRLASAGAALFCHLSAACCFPIMAISTGDPLLPQYNLLLPRSRLPSSIMSISLMVKPASLNAVMMTCRTLVCL